MSKYKGPLQNKSYEFALKVVKTYQNLANNKKEFVLSKQLLRSGTSIGSNIEEAQGGQSEKDFLSKISIAYKEAKETHYWIRLLFDSDYLKIDEKEDLLNSCEELLRIMGKIQITIKNKV